MIKNYNILKAFNRKLMIRDKANFYRNLRIIDASHESV